MRAWAFTAMPAQAVTDPREWLHPPPPSGVSFGRSGHRQVLLHFMRKVRARKRNDALRIGL